MPRTSFIAMLICLGAVGVGAGAVRAAGDAAPAAEDGQWSMPSKNYAATRYSGLAQINAGNAHGLHPVWTFSTGTLGGHEGQPLVVGDTMYVVTPWPNVLYAFDLKREGYPLRWKYRPEVSANALGVACCDAVNRGAFYADGMLVYNLLDGHTVAVDARSGRQLWNTQVADVGSGETTTMAPLVVGDRVIVGASGGEFGIYGWLKGLDLTSGRTVWTGHNLGPDADMLAQADTFKPPYGGGVDVGARSWANDSWKTGGAPVWGSISYDPQLDLIYYGTGNAAPYDPERRPGDNKWSASVLARRPQNGELVWAYQFTPHD
ncbi:MAG: PQQ-binding-like beta-propeller repeat protein, partial [Steroidobacteraceae bacterium]